MKRSIYQETKRALIRKEKGHVSKYIIGPKGLSSKYEKELMSAWPWEAGVLGVLQHHLQIFLSDIFNVYHDASCTKLSHSRQPQMTFFSPFFKTFFRKIISDVSLEENCSLNVCIHRINLHEGSTHSIKQYCYQKKTWDQKLIL